MGFEKWFLRLRGGGSYDTASEQSSTDGKDKAAPKDRFHLVYLSMMMAGVGFLVPYSTYIGAIDYFFYYYKVEFPSLSVVFPVAYFMTTFFATTLNLFLVKLVGVHSRIAFGYVVFIICLLTVPLLDIGISNCTIPTGVSFYITVFSIGFVGLGSGVQQSSYYGLSSMLPRRYTQAVMVGESVAEVLEIGLRIISKGSVKSDRVGAIVFFSLSLCLIILCIVCHIYIRRSKMVQFYTNKCRTNNRNDKEGAVKFKDNQLLLKDTEQSDSDTGKNGVVMHHATRPRQAKLSRESLRVFWNVVVQIWPLIGANFFTYYFTVLVFPGLISDVLDCSLGTWTPVLLIAIFSFGDFATRWLALLPIRWSPKQLLVASLCRIPLVPLIVMCVSPSPLHPLLGNNAVVWAALFTLLLGLSNGYVGSLPLIVVSAHVKDDRDKELAGTIMTWALMFGLVSGAVCAYVFVPLTTIIEDDQFCTSTNMTSTFVFSSCTNLTSL